MALDPLTTKAKLEERAGGSARLAQYSDSNDAKITDAIATATSTFRETALNFFTEVSIDELTPATLPEDAQRHIENLALYFLSHPSSADYEAAYVEADKWLGMVAVGKRLRSVLTPRGAASGSSGSGWVRRRSPTRTFDRETSDLDIRNPKI